jgi:hypothetical protein
VDLKISEDLPGFSPGMGRYISREDLLKLPQVSYTIRDDANFRVGSRRGACR